ncbi:hypothetical protein S40285_03505 [Stachybotrys chlorohalonatus IBT 40285]|uniref:Uncharacterized protein n=1 Tax=Stachybotrys chlorohalonatus (strain IBT 40285) TaxID=1283841 RepID=A0A084QVH4_STAC4|nr:hypothetical protein S40285_03505 [Stachybotrys chlorohalonata IBT 40285]
MSTDSGSAESGGFQIYHYTPTLAGAVLCAIAFGAASIRHAQLLIRKRTWFFIPFLVGCLFEAIGYAARAYSSSQSPDWTLMPYIIQSILILLGPAFFAASIYMLLGRLICHLEAQDHSLIQTQWLTKLFLLGDILSIFGQGGGGGLLAASDSPSTQDLGNTVILLGLGIQVAFFSGFMIVAGLFHLQITKRPTAKSRSTPSPWKKLIMVLYLVSILIMVRSVFRMIEYAQGHNGALIRREIYVYILDALLMLIVTILFSVWHPSTLIAGENKVKVPSDESSDTIPMFGRYASIA